MVKIAVLGCGLMGMKIAGEMAYHGHRVKIYDSNIAALNLVFERLEEDKKNLREEGLMLHKNFIGQVLCMSQLEETVHDADVIFEAVPDNADLKKDLFEKVSHLCPGDAILCSNTLRLSITDLAENVLHKQRMMGLRFLFPVYYIPEVEITPGQYTSSTTIEKVRAMLEKMGKTLFFRSGGEPLILSEEQREDRKQVRLEQIKNSSGVGYFFENAIPTLAHRGNDAPPQDDKSISMKEHDRDCAICMDRARDSLLRPCHHMITCYECSMMLLNRKDGCPICRKDITEIIRVFHS
ncbi:hypothetical protein ScPMuIL_014346 [Solemya velum]